MAELARVGATHRRVAVIGTSQQRVRGLLATECGTATWQQPAYVDIECEVQCLGRHVFHARMVQCVRVCVVVAGPSHTGNVRERRRIRRDTVLLGSAHLTVYGRGSSFPVSPTPCPVSTIARCHMCD
eukprot:7388333-Prymnesium_polylepis.2